MKYVCLIFLTSFLFSCHSKETTKQYTISDIKFPEDNIRKAIERNGICKTYFYYVDIHQLNVQSRNLTDKCDSLITERYDKHGNMIQNIDGDYRYDENNMDTFSNAGRCLSSMKYCHYVINSNDRVLYKIVTDSKFDGAQQRSDTIFYRFDTIGKITSIKFSRSNEETKYQYDDSGKVTLMLSLDVAKKYFYTSEKLDSIYLEIKENGETYTSKYYYDQDGLLYKKIEYSDHVPYFPYSARPLITYKAKSVMCE